MAFLRPARAAPMRSVEEAAELAARTQFRLLQMLSTDRRALATARLLGLPLGGAPFVQHAAARVPPPGPPPVPAGGDAAPPKKRRPRRLSEARRLVLEARPRAQAFRQKRMHAKFMQIIPLVSEYARLGPFVARASSQADAEMPAAPTAGAKRAAPADPPPQPCPSPPPQWSPSWAAGASSSDSPRTPQGRGARDREPSVDRSRTPSDASPGDGHGGPSTPRDHG